MLFSDQLLFLSLYPSKSETTHGKMQHIAHTRSIENPFNSFI